MWRKVIGHAVGTGVFVLGTYVTLIRRGTVPAGAAWREALKMGLVYGAAYAALDRIVPGR